MEEKKMLRLKMTMPAKSADEICNEATENAHDPERLFFLLDLVGQNSQHFTSEEGLRIANYIENLLSPQ